MPEPPRVISLETMKRHHPELAKKSALVMVGGRIFKREADGWHLLDNQARASVKELTDGST